jgi:hypothetical protein
MELCNKIMTNILKLTVFEYIRIKQPLQINIMTGKARIRQSPSAQGAVQPQRSNNPLFVIVLSSCSQLSQPLLQNKQAAKTIKTLSLARKELW